MRWFINCKPVLYTVFATFWLLVMTGLGVAGNPLAARNIVLMMATGYGLAFHIDREATKSTRQDEA